MLGGSAISVPGEASVIKRGPSQDPMSRKQKKALKSSLEEGAMVVNFPPSGFKNEGNTCYANAALQCLLATVLSNALRNPRCYLSFKEHASFRQLMGTDIECEKDQRRQDDSDGESKENLEGGEDPPEEEQIQQPQKPQPDAKEHHKMSELCQWVTKELTAISRKHSKSKHESNSSMLSHISNFLSSSSHHVIDPSNITRQVHKLSTCLRWGRQEDAHEFLRALLSALIMDGSNKQLSCLFDGLLESAVTCQTCNHTSLTRDRYMDLSLEINDPAVTNLPEALDHFTKTELLSEDNLVQCDKCNEKRRVNKGLRLATAPSILVCHLKRFEYDMYGRTSRLDKHISFPTELDISNFMMLSNKSVSPVYELVAVLVHQGQSCNSGHYISFVRGNGPPGTQRPWYRISDASVQQVSEETVLDQRAYILMYEVSGMRHHESFIGQRDPTGSIVSSNSSNKRSMKVRRRSSVRSLSSSSIKTEKKNVSFKLSPKMRSGSEISLASLFSFVNLCTGSSIIDNVCGPECVAENDSMCKRSVMSQEASKLNLKYGATRPQDELIGLDIYSERDGAASDGSTSGPASSKTDDDLQNERIEHDSANKIELPQQQIERHDPCEEEGIENAQFTETTESSIDIPKSGPNFKRGPGESNLSERNEDAETSSCEQVQANEDACEASTESDDGERMQQGSHDLQSMKAPKIRRSSLSYFRKTKPFTRMDDDEATKRKLIRSWSKIPRTKGVE